MMPSVIPHILIRNALGSAMADRLFAHAMERQHEASAGRIGRIGSGAPRVDETIRAAQVIPDVSRFAADFDAAIDGILPGVRSRLGVGPFVPGPKQVSMVAYGDGAFYAKHIDTFITPAVREHPLRQITFVYYFFCEPKGFQGGELRLYNVRQTESVDLTPERDLLVAFPSWMTHEVLRVSCPGGFADRRFAVNIWVTGLASSSGPPTDGGG
jgi:predicted 2-oxoglutarate/Fe(II)-dependent dioxygenase YbiX